MENLSALINSLSPGEDKLIRHFYKLRDFGEYRKRVQLFDLVVEAKARDEISLAKLMGYTSANASYHNLKSRLKSDIVCILLMQESSSKFSTPYAQAAFSCRRALLTGEILLSRGVYAEGINLLRKASRVAAKFELYAERIIAEDSLRNHHAGSNASDELNLGTEAIESNYRLLGNMMQAKKKLYEITFPEGTAEEQRTSYAPEEILFELEYLEKQSDSSRVRFYSQLSKLNIFNTAGDLDNAMKCAKGLLKSIETDPVIMSKTNQAGIELGISNMFLRSSDFPNAALHATKAASLFKIGLLNHLRALTILFYAQVHCKEISQAKLTLESIFNCRSIKEHGNEPLRHRILLLKSWFGLIRGEVDNAATSLRLCSDLTKEKGLWFYGYSLLECMIMIEKRAYDAALYKLDAFRKVISRNAKDAYAKRIALIVGLLRNLIRHEGDFMALVDAQPKELKLLRSSDPEIAWDPTGFELVRVDEWILERSNVKA